MFRSFFLSFILLMALPSYSSLPVLLKAPQTPLEEFSAYIQTEDITSYSKSQVEEIQEQSSAVKQLTVLLEQAQKSFLKDHLHQSGDYFRSIVKKAYKKDWGEEAQKIIFYSFLRLAQIEWKGFEAEAFLYSASVFAPHLNPDTELFPPPLIQKFQSIKKNQARLSVSLKQIFPFHEIVLINGRVFSNKVRLPYGEYKVTALSSSHKKWSRVISLSKLVQKRVVTAPLVSGSCQNPVFSKGVDKRQVLFPDFCLWSDDLMNPKIDLPETYAENEIQKNVEDLKNTSHNKELRKWGFLALAAVGAVVTVVILTRDSSGKNSTKQPVKKKSVKKQPVKFTKGFP